MADIDQIIAGGAGASSRADFSGLGKLLDSYWGGKDQAAKNDLRDAFKGGVPLTPDGQPDFGAMAKTLFQKGGLNEGTAAANLGLAQQKTEYGQRIGEQAFPTGQPAQAAALTPVDAPSPSRTVQGKVAPELSKGGVQGPGQSSQQGQETPKSYLEKQGLQPGYNMEVALAYFKNNGIEPDQPFDPNDPKLAKLQPVMKRLGSVGQVQPPQPGDNQPGPQVAQAPPQMAPQQPQVAQAQPNFNDRFSAARPGGDPTLGGLVPAGRTPQQQIDGLTRAISSNMLTPEVVKTYQARIDAITKAIEPTTEMKNSAAPGLMERQGEQAAQQAGAVEAAKGYVTKYNNIDEAGTKAIQEIPKLQLALKLMDSPDFQSGSGQRFDLAYRRIAVRVGGNPDKAAPQEIVSKVIADSILNGLGSLKGLGPIRVAEMNLARTAAMSMDNTPQTNKFLANVAIRIQQRAVEVSDMAQNYNDGVLDVGFDKKLREMDKSKPLFTPDEVQRFHKIIGGEEKQPKQGAQPANQQAFANQKFSSPDAAIAAGAKKGDVVTDADGKQWRIR